MSQFLTSYGRLVCHTHSKQREARVHISTHDTSIHAMVSMLGMVCWTWAWYGNGQAVGCQVLLGVSLHA